MARFAIVFPGDPPTRIIYGFDKSAVGYFLTAIKGRSRVVEYDGLCPGYAGLSGLLRALEAVDGVDTATIQLAVDTLVEGDADDALAEPVRAVATMVANLRRAAGE